VPRICDVGGLTGFGPVERTDEPSPLREDWERTIFGVSLCYAATVSVAAFRDVVDRMAPGHYLTASYWERWVTGLASLLVEQGVTTPEELTERAAGAFPLCNPPTDDSADVKRLIEGARTTRPSPRFAVGDAVSVREWDHRGHTRCPSYVQGKRGTVVRVNYDFALPDLEVASGEEILEPSYGVRFTARAVWGAAATSEDYLHADLYESYLQEVK
jgi:nitrile hydratase subunit beta